MANRKSEPGKTADQDERTIIYAFVIPTGLAEKFEALVKENKQSACRVLNTLVDSWVENN